MESIHFQIKGMNRDISLAKFSYENAYEIYNMRLTATDNQTTFALTNEKGNLERTYVVSNVKYNMYGTPIGAAVLDNLLYIFTHEVISNERRDRLYEIEINQKEGSITKIRTLFNPDDIVTDAVDESDNTVVDLTEVQNCNYTDYIDLNLDIDHPLDIIPYFESKLIKKLYWIDGKNQPRMFNVVSRNMTIDFLPEIGIDNKITITKLDGGGLFPAGVILYCFTMGVENGLESNIFYTSPLYYLTRDNQSGLPVGEFAKCSFRIQFNKIDMKHYDYVIVYSILRTTKNGEAECRRVGKFKPDIIYIKGNTKDSTITTKTAENFDLENNISCLYISANLTNEPNNIDYHSINEEDSNTSPIANLYVRNKHIYRHFGDLIHEKLNYKNNFVLRKKINSEIVIPDNLQKLNVDDTDVSGEALDTLLNSIGFDSALRDTCMSIHSDNWELFYTEANSAWNYVKNNAYLYYIGNVYTLNPLDYIYLSIKDIIDNSVSRYGCIYLICALNDFNVPTQILSALYNDPWGYYNLTENAINVGIFAIATEESINDYSYIINILDGSQHKAELTDCKVSITNDNIEYSITPDLENTDWSIDTNKDFYFSISAVKDIPSESTATAEYSNLETDLHILTYDDALSTYNKFYEGGILLLYSDDYETKDSSNLLYVLLLETDYPEKSVELNEEYSTLFVNESISLLQVLPNYAKASATYNTTISPNHSHFGNYNEWDFPSEYIKYNKGFNVYKFDKFLGNTWETSDGKTHSIFSKKKDKYAISVKRIEEIDFGVGTVILRGAQKGWYKILVPDCEYNTGALSLFIAGKNLRDALDISKPLSFEYDHNMKKIGTEVYTKPLGDISKHTYNELPNYGNYNTPLYEAFTKDSFGNRTYVNLDEIKLEENAIEISAVHPEALPLYFIYGQYYTEAEFFIPNDNTTLYIGILADLDVLLDVAIGDFFIMHSNISRFLPQSEAKILHEEYSNLILDYNNNQKSDTEKAFYSLNYDILTTEGINPILKFKATIEIDDNCESLRQNISTKVEEALSGNVIMLLKFKEGENEVIKTQSLSNFTVTNLEDTNNPDANFLLETEIEINIKSLFSENNFNIFSNNINKSLFDENTIYYLPTVNLYPKKILSKLGHYDDSYGDTYYPPILITITDFIVEESWENNYSPKYDYFFTPNYWVKLFSALNQLWWLNHRVSNIEIETQDNGGNTTYNVTYDIGNITDGLGGDISKKSLILWNGLANPFILSTTKILPQDITLEAEAPSYTTQPWSWDLPNASITQDYNFNENHNFYGFSYYEMNGGVGYSITTPTTPITFKSDTIANYSSISQFGQYFNLEIGHDFLITRSEYDNSSSFYGKIVNRVFSSNLLTSTERYLNISWNINQENNSFWQGFRNVDIDTYYSVYGDSSESNPFKIEYGKDGGDFNSWKLGFSIINSNNEHVTALNKENIYFINFGNIFGSQQVFLDEDVSSFYNDYILEYYKPFFLDFTSDNDVDINEINTSEVKYCALVTDDSYTGVPKIKSVHDNTPSLVTLNLFGVNIPATHSNIILKWDNTKLYKETPDSKTVSTVQAPRRIYKSFIDTHDSTQEIIEPSHLYITCQRPKIVPQTFEVKDGTMFLGNLKVDTPVIDDLTRSRILKDREYNSENEWLPTEHTMPAEGDAENLEINTNLENNFRLLEHRIDNTANSYGELNVLDLNSQELKIFKGGEYYRVGIQFENKYAYKSDVLDLGHIKINPFEITGTQLKTYFPQYTLPEKVVEELIEQGYTSARLMIEDKTYENRTVLTLGIVSPTVFDYSLRADNKPFGMSSWFFRPYGKLACLPHKHFEPLMGSNSLFKEILSIEKTKRIDLVTISYSTPEIHIGYFYGNSALRALDDFVIIWGYIKYKNSNSLDQYIVFGDDISEIENVDNNIRFRIAVEHGVNLTKGEWYYPTSSVPAANTTTDDNNNYVLQTYRETDLEKYSTYVWVNKFIRGDLDRTGGSASYSDAHSLDSLIKHYYSNNSYSGFVNYYRRKIDGSFQFALNSANKAYVTCAMQGKSMLDKDMRNRACEKIASLVRDIITAAKDSGLYQDLPDFIGKSLICNADYYKSFVDDSNRVSSGSNHGIRKGFINDHIIMDLPSNMSYPHLFYVDSQLLTLHSPNIEDIGTIISNNNVEARLVGNVELTNSTSFQRIELETRVHSLICNGVVTNYLPYLQKYDMVVSYLGYHDDFTHSYFEKLSNNPDLFGFKSMGTSNKYFITYPWHRANSLGSQLNIFNAVTDDAENLVGDYVNTWYGKPKTKCLSNIRHFKLNNILSEPTPLKINSYGVWDNSSVSAEVLNAGQTSVIYYLGDVDYAYVYSGGNSTTDLQWYIYSINNSAFSEFIEDTLSDTSNNNDNNNHDFGNSITNKGFWLLIEGEQNIIENDGNIYLPNGNNKYCQDPIQIRYKSTPHCILLLDKALYRVPLYEENSNTEFTNPTSVAWSASNESWEGWYLDTGNTEKSTIPIVELYLKPIRKDINQTEICWVPIGDFVSILGDKKVIEAKSVSEMLEYLFPAGSEVNWPIEFNVSDITTILSDILGSDSFLTDEAYNTKVLSDDTNGGVVDVEVPLQFIFDRAGYSSLNPINDNEFIGYEANISYVKGGVSYIVFNETNSILFLLDILDGLIGDNVEDKISLYNSLKEIKADRYPGINLGDLLYTVSINEVSVSGTEGDHFYGRWDCLKTYAYSEEDVNLVVDIVSVPLETPINVHARTDRNRGAVDNTVMSPRNFNLFNDVYDLSNNFFTYINSGGYAESPQDDTDNLFENEMVWSLTKNITEGIDSWSCITTASVMDLDGTKGKINKLKVWNGKLLAFQDTAITYIPFNARVAISADDGVPIEISNGNKIAENPVVIFDNIGCLNKWSMCATPSTLYFIDNYNKGIYLLRDEGPICISDLKGFHSWMIQNNTTDSWTLNDNSSNFRTFYDNINQEIYFVNNNYALAYSELNNEFTSFYNYEGTPFMVNVYDHFYGIKNNFYASETVSTLWEMWKGDYNMFYNVFKPYYLTFIANDNPLTTKVFNTITYTADMFKPDGTFDYTNTFDTITAETEYLSGTYTNLVSSKAYEDYIKDSSNITATQQLNTIEISGTYNPRTRVRRYSNSTTNEEITPHVLRKKFRVWNLEIPRDKDNTLYRGYDGEDRLDKMSNPWIKLTLQKDVENTDRLQLYDILVNYTVL